MQDVNFGSLGQIRENTTDILKKLEHYKKTEKSLGTTGKTLETLRKQETRQCYKNVGQTSESLLDGRQNCRNVRKNFWNTRKNLAKR